MSRAPLPRWRWTLSLEGALGVDSVIPSQKLIYGIKMFRVKRLGKVWKL